MRTKPTSAPGIMLFAAAAFLSITAATAAPDPCTITVVDLENGWPVPMVELKTTHNVSFVSDNAGVIAFDLPEFMGRESGFSVEGHGYGIPPDGFGFSGVRLTPTPGGGAMIKVSRTLPAKRLGRLTGAGIFGESQRFGLEESWRESGLTGSDSVQIARHNGKLFWAWGDSNIARYPLGIFHMTGATTELHPLKSMEPPIRMHYNYFRDQKGAVRAIAEMPGTGPAWVSGYVSLPDRNGGSKLVGTDVKIRDFLTAYESGLCVWDDSAACFKKHRTLWTKSEANLDQPPCPDGHPISWTDQSGKEWILFGDPFPRLKMEATFEAWENPSAWETMVPQPSVPTWEGDREIVPHRGSVAWNPYRKKWVAVFTQMHGSPSSLGEIWYAESDKPVGTWGSAVKVVTHQNYTFYNPRLHPELADPDSPILLFEGTFTRQFASMPTAPARYDYNQILYRLDLDDPDLVTPTDQVPKK